MTDIQQWRRMIQPTRTRTPAVEHEEADAILSPTTPRKGLKPKFSSYFTQHANNAWPTRKESSPPRNDAGDAEWPLWPTEDPYPSPDADVLIDSVMCRILSSPYEGLNPRFNGVLLQIFEGFRALADEKKRLLAKSDQDNDRLSAMEEVMQKSARQWNHEKQEYEAEIKRPELLLSKGKGGLAEVTFARQDSLLRLRESERSAKARKHDTLETIFQFMERNKRVEEKVWGTQRAMMRRKSPSAETRRLSKTLMSQTSSYPDLPPGTLTEGPNALAEESYLKRSSSGERIRAESDPKTSFSEDDTISTFSCVGDFLPDEASNVTLIEAAGTNNDFVAIKRIAQVLARRRNVDVDVVIPKLLEMFAAYSLDTGCDASKVSPRAQTAMDQAASAPPTRKNTKLMAKASGFFHKLRPQLNVDTTVAEGRRFSFEAGDDSAMSAPGLPATPRTASSSALLAIGVNERVLRKSASTPLLVDQTGHGEAHGSERALSPVEQSPTSSTPVSESRRVSKIPTPIYYSTPTLARPRQERESSESSLLTAIKYSETTDRRSSPLSGSSYSSPSASRMDLTAGSQGATNNRLLEHTKALRGSPFAAAAAARAVENAQMSVDRASPTIHEKRPSVQKADMSEHGKENARPMNAPNSHADHEDLH